MANKQSLNISELDFSELKSLFKNFLKNQSEFSDYDFDGSGLSVLLDVLAFNTTLNSFYLNAAINENFLDSAIKRSSVISRAKDIGYTPRSSTAAYAIIDLTISGNTSTSGQIIIPKWTKFSTTVDSNTYIFSTVEAKTVTKNIDNNYVANNVIIKEGSHITNRFTVDKYNADQRFEIPNANIDTTTLSVVIQNSTDDATQTSFKLASDLIKLTSLSNVYWIEENENGLFELKFGDDVIGASVKHNNIIICDYLTTSGELANKASTFINIDSIAGFTEGISITTDTVAAGGESKESIDSIRYLAPRSWASQNRCVPATDYKTILEQYYTNIDSVSVWGGEDAIPPVYGKVYIAIKPKTGSVLTDTAKEEIISTILNSRNVVSITPEIVDPEYIFLKINSNVKFNSRDTNQTSTDLKSNVLTTIKNYISDNLGKFDNYFKFSKLTSTIDNISTAIYNNLTSVKMKKKFIPSLTTVQSYTINFNNAFYNPYSGYQGTLTSSYFTHDATDGNLYTNCLFEDDGNGIILIKRVNPLSGVKTTIESNVGTIDYVNGILIINSTFNPSSFIGDYISLILEPNSNDIVPTKNQIVTAEEGDISITMTDISNIS